MEELHKQKTTFQSAMKNREDEIEKLRNQVRIGISFENVKLFILIFIKIFLQKNSAPINFFLNLKIDYA